MNCLRARKTNAILILWAVAVAACSSSDSGSGEGGAEAVDQGGAGGTAGTGGWDAGGTGGSTSTGEAPMGGSGGTENAGFPDAGPGGSNDALGGASGSGGATGHDCQSPDSSWLLCEDFEQGDGDWEAWWATTDFLGGPGSGDRGRIDLDDAQVHGGSWSAYLPASASSGYQGATLDWWACDGPQQSNCPLRSFDELYYRVWVRFAPDHRYVHHFLNISGSQPDDFTYHGTAGCMPNGELSMGTTVDHRRDSHESFFYTYFPGMSCDTNCGNYADVDSFCEGCEAKGLPTCSEQKQCCWGNVNGPQPPQAFPVGQWFCFEMMMRANTVGQSDGQMAYWVDGQQVHAEQGMMWRTDPRLALNRVRLQHYIETGDAQGHSNRVWFDDVVVSTKPIGCQ